MELKDLVGERLLSGVDLVHLEVSDGDADECAFILDGVRYFCKEDPSDGYRSYLSNLEQRDGANVMNMFPPQRVLCYMEAAGADNSAILAMRDVVTGKEVLRIGTGDADDYYPYCVLEFHPQNMACNAPHTRCKGL